MKTITTADRSIIDVDVYSRGISLALEDACCLRTVATLQPDEARALAAALIASAEELERRGARR